MTDKYEVVIGLEVHVELATQTKIFCSCKTHFGDTPNTHVCPVCMGLPGSLPVLNEKAVEYAIKAGLATGCRIAEYTRFDRKNYFYPDLPKAYQISQYELPVCTGGGIEICVSGEKKSIGITRIHLEEDAGKLIHDREAGTLIDYNRCGVPLIEIVTEPDIRSSEEAKAFLTELRTVLLYTKISDCKMNEGSLRCDVNLSVRKKGDAAFGVRTEMKNINSFSFVAKAIEYEYARQVAVLESGGKVLPETRRFDSQTGQTHTMRVKESAADYRFFPEPDLPPFHIERERIEDIAHRLPMLPARRRALYTERYLLSESDASVIASSPALADYFENAADLTKYHKTAANLILSELLATTDTETFSPPVTAEQTAELATLYGEQTVNSSTVKKLLKILPDEKAGARELVKRLGLEQINDREYIAVTLDKVLKENPKLLCDYTSGKLAAKKAIIGKVMAATGGKANPRVLDEVFDKRLK